MHSSELDLIEKAKFQALQKKFKYYNKKKKMHNILKREKFKYFFYYF